MRRMQWMAVALAVLATAGCGVTKKQSMNTTSDSLVAGNPQELPPGNLNPQGSYAPAPARTAARTRSYAAPARTYRSTRSYRTSSGTTVSRLVPAGTAIHVRPTATVSSKTSSVGETWTGVVTSPVVVDGRTVIPAGATVTGSVLESVPAERGGRARLQLGVSSVAFDGRSYRVRGSSEEIVAGSTRTRNVGGIVAGTAAGALIGRAVGGSGKGALIGGLVGAGASGAAVAASKGYQARVESDKTITIYAR